ncbi:EAL domain-containing protein [Pseudomonas sp. MOB-449]|nr:EAL domain-containing protein [Pseudomonas sp. MOB-449]
MDNTLVAAPKAEVWSGSSLDDNSKSLTSERILCDALEALRNFLGMEFAFISEFSEGRRVFRHVAAGTEPVPIHVGGSDPLEESYCQRIIDGRLPELIHNALELPEALVLPATRAIPVGAHLSVPICFSDGTLYGTLCCFSTQAKHTLDARDLAVMRVLSDFTGRQLEREEGKRRELQQLKSEIKTILDNKSYTVVYQPIVHLREHKIVGYEALARFSTIPTRSPDKWFKQARLVALQQELEVAVITKALEVLHLLPDGAYLSLNASSETLLSGVLPPLTGNLHAGTNCPGDHRA